MKETKPDQFDLSKLPKWAQNHIRDLEWQRDATVRTLNEFLDGQTPSSIYIEDHPCTGEDGRRGPIHKRCYLQTHRVGVTFAGVTLDITLRERGHSICLQWSAEEDAIGGEIAFIPESYQGARLVAKENMR